MDRPPANPLNTLPLLRQHLDLITRAALAAVDAGTLVTHALASPEVSGALTQAAAVHVLAAGKAAGAMLDALMLAAPREIRAAVGIGPQDARPSVGGVEWIDAGHPVPTEGSLQGAQRARAMAQAIGPDDLLLVLLSGGGSALMAMPADGLTLADKQATVRTLLAQGADIYQLNTVRKHLSAVKGGLLAAAAPGRTLTLVVSDVVGDDLSFIASGPTVPDDSTFRQALDVLIGHGGVGAFPSAVVARLEDGVLGLVPETPATGDARMARASATVIGRQRGALEDAARVARDLGYRVIVVPQPVTGEAREAAVAHVRHVADLVAGSDHPACVLSSGETTVTVRGRGRGGRNQEFACAAAPHLGVIGPCVALGSLGTDGIDGPTDAAGAVADTSTLERAAAHGLPSVEAFLRENDSYTFFDALGDLIRTGPTRTNVGDVQVTLIG